MRIRLAKDKEWRDVPLTHGYTENSRGMGVADMASPAIREGRPHRASGELAYHVLDVMAAFEGAPTAGRHVAITSGPPGLRRGPGGYLRSEIDRTTKNLSDPKLSPVFRKLFDSPIVVTYNSLRLSVGATACSSFCP